MNCKINITQTIEQIIINSYYMLLYFSPPSKGLVEGIIGCHSSLFKESVLQKLVDTA